VRVYRGLLVNDASLAGHHGSALVTDRAKSLAQEVGIDLTIGWPWSKIEDTLSRTHEFEVVIVNGEGSIHHDSPSARRIAQLALLLHAQNIPAFLVNASEEANSHEILRGLAAFRRIYVRDEASRQSLSKASIPAHVVSDLTLSWKHAPQAGGIGELLVTDASDNRKSERLIDLARKWSARPVTMRCPPPRPRRGFPTRWLSHQAKSLIAGFAPMGAWQLRYRPTANTYCALARILAEEASGIICGRYHAVCFALCQGLPFLAIEGNIGKVAALLGDIGMRDRLRSLEELESMTGRPRIPAFSDEEHQRRQLFLADTRRRAGQMFRDIANDLANPVVEPARFGDLGP
jgi:polysaccharide pyruvyl transferase WcaK-like protein